MAKSFLDLLKESELEKISEAAPEDMDQEFEDDSDDAEMDDDDFDEEKPKEESVDDVAPEGKGEYDADDLREVIDYVYEILDKEDDGEENDSVEEIGLDLIYEYADVLPDTVINQIVDDLKEMFEIEDTMLESALFVKSKKGAAAKAAKKQMTKFYKRNKKTVKARAKAWRASTEGKKLARLHKKVYRGAACFKKKVIRLHTPDGMPKKA